jgi:hypothetical protein
VNELVAADAAFAHVLHGGRAVVAAQGPEPLSEEDEDFLGLPGMLTPEQVAALFARRDSAARRRAAGLPEGALEPSDRAADGAVGGAGAVGAPDGAASWRAGQELRRELNRLVSVFAARTGAAHGQVHAQLRRAVPGPASAAADLDVLARRRDHLMELLGG